MSQDNRVNLSITVMPTTKKALALLKSTKNNSKSRLVENALLVAFHSEPGFIERCRSEGVTLPPDPRT